MDITKEFKILPSNGQIGDLLQEDAMEIAETIQGEIVKTIKTTRGSVTICKNIPDPWRSRVHTILKKWVEIYKYNIQFNGDEIRVFSKAYEDASDKNFCVECKKRKGLLLGTVIAWFGIITTSLLFASVIVLINLAIWFGAEETHDIVFGLFFANLIGFVISVPGSICLFCYFEKKYKKYFKK